MEDAGFKKIDFGTDKKTQLKKPSAASARSSQFSIKHMSKRKTKFGRRGFGIVGVVIALLVLLGIYGIFQGISVYSQAQSLYKQAKLAGAAAKLQNVVLAKDELVKTKTEAEKLQKKL